MNPEIPTNRAEMGGDHSAVFEPVAMTYLGNRAIESHELEEASILGQIHRENPNIEVRPYQVDCLDALERTRDNGGDVALVQMATGLGKTTIVASDVKRYLQAKPESRVLFLCHQNDILRQARKRFEDILGKRNHTFGTFNGNSKRGIDADCVFASFQTMGRWKGSFEPDTFDYIVVDESHHGKAKTYEPTIQYFKPDFLLGVTATPDRKDLLDIREIFGKEVYSKSLVEALGERLLAHPNYRVILDNVEDHLSISGDETLSMRELNRTFFIPKRDEEIAKIIEERLSAIVNPRTIIFCPSIEHSERMAALLDKSKAINSSMNITKRTAILESFREGAIDTVLTVDLFNEGIDIADANAVVFLRSTQSETIFLQQLGRGLRKIPGKDEVLVLDFVANCDRLLMIEKLLHETATYTSGHIRRVGGEAAEDIDLYGVNFSSLDGDISTLRELHVGSFQFTETTRKILEMIDRIKRREAEILPPPEGVESLRAFALGLGVSPVTMHKIAQESGLTLPTYMFRTSAGLGVDEEARTVLLNKAHEFLNTPLAPEGVKSVGAFALEIGTTRKYLYEILEERGLEPAAYKFISNIALGLTQEQQAVVLNDPSIAKRPPEGVVSVNKFARSLGIAFTTLKDILTEEGIMLPDYKFGPKVSGGLDEGTQGRVLQLPKIIDLTLPPAPPNVKSVKAFSQETGMHSTTVRRIIEEEKLQLPRYRFGTTPTVGLDEEMQRFLLSRKGSKKHRSEH